jgi:hypothetical protein
MSVRSQKISLKLHANESICTILDKLFIDEIDIVETADYSFIDVSTLLKLLNVSECHIIENARDNQFIKYKKRL